MRLKRVGVLSLGKVFGVMGLMVGGIFVVVSLEEAQGPVEVFAFDTAMVIVAPLAYGAAGFFSGIVYAFIYNVIAGVTGGIELEFDLN
ncbi:MAG: hypothetical protein R3C19_02280 [Planctomycetaceae bacterium]